MADRLVVRQGGSESSRGNSFGKVLKIFKTPESSRYSYLGFDAERSETGRKRVGQRDIVASQHDQVHGRQELLQAQTTVLQVVYHVTIAQQMSMGIWEG